MYIIYHNKITKTYDFMQIFMIFLYYLFIVTSMICKLQIYEFFSTACFLGEVGHFLNKRDKVS